MNCPRCGKKIEKGWNFCPFCGFRPGTSMVFGGAFGGIFNKLMGRLAKQIEDIDRQTRDMERDFERNFEVFDLSPFFRNMERISKDMKVTGKPHVRGFTIRISRTKDQQPRVDVKTFGNMDENMQRQIQEQLTKMGVRQVRMPAKAPMQQARPTKETRAFPTPKVTEEPKTNVRRINSKVFVDMEIPGVKSEQDIEINELENSVEVRAIAGDKAYFKILTKPAQFRLSQKEFSKGKLHLEFT